MKILYVKHVVQPEPPIAAVQIESDDNKQIDIEIVDLRSKLKLFMFGEENCGWVDAQFNKESVKQLIEILQKCHDTMID